MSPYITEISELEEEGRYLDAYEEWYKQAIEELLDSKLRPWVGGGSIHGCLVYATSCGVRGKLPTKSRFAAASTGFLTEHVKQNPPSSEAEAFIASCIEWSGDAYLLIAPEQAIIRYKQAMERYDDASTGAARRWGMEAGHEHSLDAIYRYFETVEHTLPDKQDLSSHEYHERLETKLQLVVEVLSKEYD
jgi:hypothetical protein